MAHKWGLVVDLDRCTGCEACVVACHAENNVPTAGRTRLRVAARCSGFVSNATGRAISRIRAALSAGDVPAMRRRALRAGLPHVCQLSHRRRAERAGLQPLHRHALLRQCLSLYCAFFNFFNPAWDKPLNLQLNPDVSVRSVGIMEKCTFCVQRIKSAEIQAEAEKRELKDGEFTTACAQSCASKALVFGDLDDPRARFRGWRVRIAAPNFSANSAPSPTLLISSEAPGRMQRTAEQIERRSAAADLHERPGYQIAVGLAALLVLAGVCAFGYQVYNGIGVWGINSPVFWAFDITNFVFWIGISHAGTLISAILRLCNATLAAAGDSLRGSDYGFSILIGGLIPLCHIGRPWLAFWLIPYPNQRGIWPNFRSPLVWDFFAISTYLTGSTTFLYLADHPGFRRQCATPRRLAQEDLQHAGARMAGHAAAMATA